MNLQLLKIIKIKFCLFIFLNISSVGLNTIDSKYIKYFKTAEEFAKKLGFKLDKSKIKIFIEKDSTGTGSVIRFDTEDFSVEVDRKLNKVVGYFNYKVLHTHTKIVENEKRIKLNLTKEEVVNIAKKFIKEILGEDISDYSPKIGCHKSRRKWWIIFYKTYNGIIFQNCWFNFGISDPLKKIIYFGRKIPLEKISIPKIKISEEEAIKKARKVAIIFYNLCRRYGYGRLWELGKVVSVKKAIAIPPFIFPTSKKEWKKIEKGEIKISNKPRLVYIVLFERIVAPYEFNPYGIEIWIDAKTGKVVGGDQYL